MSLRKEFVHLLASKITEELVKDDMIDVPVGFDLTGQIEPVLEGELAIEDQINEEVRAVLTQYAEHMRQNGISYQEMFKLIKNKIVREKKIVL